MAKKAKRGLRLWSVIHYHRHGNCAYLALAARQPSPESVIGDDYDPEDEREGAEVSELNPNAGIPVIERGRQVGEVSVRALLDAAAGLPRT